MRPSDSIEKQIIQTTIETNSDADKVVLSDAVNAMSKSKQKTPAFDKPELWRIIMNNKMTRFAAVAVIILAGIIIVNQFGGSVDGAGVIWAGVVEKCHSFKTATYNYTRLGTFIHQEKEYDSIQIKYSFAYGKYKTTQIAGNSRSGDQLILTQSITNDNNQVFSIDHENKRFSRYSQTDFEDSLPDSQVSDRDLVSMLKSLPLKADEVIGRKVINGKNTVGFLLKGYGIDIKLWVDDETYNPVLVEFFDDNSFELEGVYSEFCFDISIDESEFDIQLPTGYSEIDMSAIFKQTVQYTQCTVNDFIYYLGLFAKYSEDGCFPDRITISKDKVGLYATVGLRPIVKAKCTESEIKEFSMKGPRTYQFLNQMKPENDWHYAGKGVSPAQLDTPIFWWKENGSEYYTVIFADLSIGTLTEKELP